MRSAPTFAALVLALSFGLAAPTAVHAEDPPLPAETFFQRSAILSPQLSPSGTRLAFTTALGQNRTSLVVIDLTTSQALTRAGMDDADVVDFHWVNDDRLVFSGRDLQHWGTDVQRHFLGLFTVKTDGSRIKRLVRTEERGFVSNGMDETVLDGNHVLLSVPEAQPGVEADEVVLGRYQYSGEEFDSITPIWVNTRDASWRDVPLGKDAPEHADHWWFDTAGHPRAVLTEHKGEAAYYWQGPGQTAWHLLIKAPLLQLPFAIHSVDDAGNLFVIRRDASNMTVLTRFDFDKMEPSDKPLVKVPGFDFEGQVLQDKPGSAAIGVRVNADAEGTVWFDPAMRAFQEEVDAKLPGRSNRISCRHCGEANMTALVFSYSDRDPGIYFVYQQQTKKWLRVMAVHKDVPAKRMAQVDFRRIKARDGLDLPVWLTIPPGVQAGHPAPTVVMVHGGPWVREGYWQWNAMNQFLASRGYLVIEPEFRGSEGYGLDHLHAGYKQWGQSMESDLADALHWAQDQGLAAKDQACIMGGSYGGYAALMGPVRSPDAYRCVVASSAVSDLGLYLSGSWLVDDDITAEGRKYYLPSTVGDPDKDAALIKANSPVLLAAQMKAPVMLVWGDADLRVPIDHGKRMREALIAAGNPPEWVVYEDEGHGWANTANQIDFAKRVEAFLAKNLK